MKQMLHLAAIAAASLGMAQAGTVTFSDDDFVAADWTVTEINRANGGSVTATELASGGNPDAYRRIVNVVNAGAANSTVFGFHWFAGATYDPSVQGAISSIDYAEDAIMYAGFGDGQATGLALYQDGRAYAMVGTVTGSSSSWHSIVINGLQAADFNEWTTNAYSGVMPDFSATGSLIQLGFFRANSTPNVNGYTTDGGIDNWSVTIHSIDNNAVPLPGFALAVPVLAGGLFSMRRRRAG